MDDEKKAGSEPRPNGAMTTSDEGDGALPTAPLTEEARHRLEDVTAALLAVMARLRWEEKERSAKAKHYPFPFVVDEQFIRKLNKRAGEWLERAGLVPGAAINVVAEVRFQDLSSSRFAALDEFLDKAGDQRDPERLTISWSALLQDPPATSATIEAIFTTEKPLETGEQQLLEYPVASMDLKVAGHDRKWVDNAFAELDPFFTSTRLAGMYKPLLIFRHPGMVHIFSWITGFIAQMIYNDIIAAMDRPAVNAVRQSRVDKIVAQPTVGAKVDTLAREVFGPYKDSPLFEGVMQFAGGMLTLLIVAIIGYMLYPKLVPRSGINIGLASARYAAYENAFRLVVFTILLSGIVIPIIRAWLF